MHTPASVHSHPCTPPHKWWDLNINSMKYSCVSSSRSSRTNTEGDLPSDLRIRMHSTPHHPHPQHNHRRSSTFFPLTLTLHLSLSAWGAATFTDVPLSSLCFHQDSVILFHAPSTTAGAAAAVVAVVLHLWEEAWRGVVKGWRTVCPLSFGQRS